MPPRKGRRRRARDRRRGEPAEAQPQAEAPVSAREPAPRRAPSSDLPKLRVRAIGFIIGVLTLFIGILNVVEGVNSGSVTYAITGVIMVVLAIVLGVLTLVPGRVRDLPTRR